MNADPLFVGRKAELKSFAEVLAEPKGQAILVVGQQGMGTRQRTAKRGAAATNA